ncbi:MAG TPA: aminopeptidase [Actinomycetota bacterium]|nr:aminopeptidase [Actinomycetota bacterium]
MTTLNDAAAVVVETHLGVRKDEVVLIITDEWRRRIAGALFEAARRAGTEPVLIEIVERKTHGAELPAAVAAAMAEADVVIAPTTKSLSHTSARKSATERGARVASMPEVTEAMMERCLAADPGRLSSLGAAYAEALTNASQARLSSPSGTECTFNLLGRTGISDDGDLTKKGAFGNLPAGEAFIAPVETDAEGVIVFDASLSPDYLLDSPVRVVVKGGVVMEVSGGAAPLFLQLPKSFGPDAWRVAELGIGTNDRATITGNILEDEKVLSTAHVAFGNNASIGGVTSSVASHHDGIIKHVTLELDGKTVIREGKLLLDG